jgi:Carboxypeptidase regulatory-like domain
LRFLQALTTTVPGARVYGSIEHWEPDLFTGNRRDFGGVPDVVVNVRGSGSAFEGRTDDQGRYEIKGLPPGKYEVLALPSAAFVPPLLRRIELRDPRACSLVDWEKRYDGRIRGVVKDFSGRPASGAQVEVMADRMLLPAGIETLRTDADTEGNFEFTQVPPGRYLVGVNLTRRPNSTSVFPTTFHPGTNDIWLATVVQLKGGGRVELAPMTLPPPKR